MITVVIPTLNAAETLPAVLSALVPAAVEGLVTSVVVVDGGSEDQTLDCADAAGATIVRAARGRGSQLRAGALSARGDWLVFLHGDTVPAPGFEAELAAFCRGTGRFSGLPAERAAVFRFALDDSGFRAVLVAFAVRVRFMLFGLAYGDQGLVISRAFYESVGGFGDIPLMEDVDIVRRIGRRRLHLLEAQAVTSAERYRRSGYLSRIARNFLCLTLYFIGVSPRRIARIYG